ncbi:hypothetical protein COF68_05530 [Bacillus toyonensis]|uniref:hypothetical protein n=1 Tax=Bacillus toyonensis TaxID=155322 RepID=UPI000BFBC988|nr:hypothetical protein [Bacillus toyonensis]PHE64304.1 hypothetical protein COF68_05530 [Bacillus toyonensis]
MTNINAEQEVINFGTEDKPDLKAVPKSEPTEKVVVVEFNDVDLSEKRYRWDGALDVEFALTHKSVLVLYNVDRKREEYIPVSRINRMWFEVIKVKG